MLARRRFGSQLQRRRVPSHRLRTGMRPLLGNLQRPQQRPRELVSLPSPSITTFLEPRNGRGLRAHAQTSSSYSGRLGNVCQFPGGTGTCSRGVCTLTSCGNGYYLSAGRCVQYDLQTDINNWHVLLVLQSAASVQSLTRALQRDCRESLLHSERGGSLQLWSMYRRFVRLRILPKRRDLRSHQHEYRRAELVSSFLRIPLGEDQHR